MSGARDFARLIELLSLEKKAYSLLLALSLAQKEVFDKVGAAGLTRVMAQKQAVIADLRSIELATTDYTSAWQGTMDAFPEQARREVLSLLDEISEIVAALQASERAMGQVLADARDAARGRARTVSEGLTATRAYGAPAAVAAGTFVDRED